MHVVKCIFYNYVRLFAGRNQHIQFLMLSIQYFQNLDLKESFGIEPKYTPPGVILKKNISQSGYRSRFLWVKTIYPNHLD